MSEALDQRDESMTEPIWDLPTCDVESVALGVMFLMVIFFFNFYKVI